MRQESQSETSAEREIHLQTDRHSAAAGSFAGSLDRGGPRLLPPLLFPVSAVAVRKIQ